MLHFLSSRQIIKSDLRTVWNFVSNPKNLSAITPEYMHFKMLGETAMKMFPGQIIEYYVRPVLGIRMHWVTEITHVEDGVYFVDEQRFGPYSFWHHKHFLKETAEGIEMIDEVHYKLPAGFLGKIANALFVKKQLQQIFDYRYQRVEAIFNRK
jgi:ligand-binding SRPBCC domain-containing protein